MIKNNLFKVRYRLWEHRLPKVITLTDFDPDGVRFEAAGVPELYRIVHRGYEPEYLGNMLAVLDSDDVLYDIGANIGLVALHAARRCATVAFEPDPGFCSRLRRNVALNPEADVDVRPIAISDRAGPVSLFSDGVEGTSPSLVHQRGERETLTVEADSLDSLIAAGAVPSPTVLKLDIEGAEILALRGASVLLNGDEPPRLLLLEVHDSFLPGFGSSADEVIALVREAGYKTVIYEAKRADQQHLILSH